MPVKDDGIGTRPGGLYRLAGNQTVLAIDPFVLEDLTDAQTKAVTLLMLNYAHDVSARAAKAYTDLVTIIDV